MANTIEIVKSRPIQSERIEYLEEAKNLLIEAINEYKTKNPEDLSDIKSLERVVEKIYSQRKAQLFVNDRFHHLNEYLNSALEFALKSKSDENVPVSKYFYLKESKRFSLK